MRLHQTDVPLIYDAILLFYANLLVEHETISGVSEECRNAVRRSSLPAGRVELARPRQLGRQTDWRSARPGTDCKTNVFDPQEDTI